MPSSNAHQRMRNIATLAKHRTVAGMVALAFTLGLAIPGCKHEPIGPLFTDDGGGGGGLVDDGLWLAPINTDPCDPNTVYFQNTVFPLLVSYCTTAGCHDAVTLENGVGLFSYASIMQQVDPGNPGNSDLWDNGIVDNNDPMPPSGSPQLTAAQEQAIYNWILQGAPNNGCNDCDTTNVTYSADIAPIFSAKCTGCHGGSAPDGNLDLTQWSTCNMIAVNTMLEGSIKHLGNYSHMPPYEDDSYLPACDIHKFMIWARNGAPNN